MNEPGAGRIWLIPEPATATIEVIDAPIYARLYDRYFPLWWVIGRGERCTCPPSTAQGINDHCPVHDVDRSE